jgi:hypothetical protein
LDETVLWPTEEEVSGDSDELLLGGLIFFPSK